MSTAPEDLRAIAEELREKARVLRRQAREPEPPIAERAQKLILAEEYERQAAEANFDANEIGAHENAQPTAMQTRGLPRSRDSAHN